MCKPKVLFSYQPSLSWYHTVGIKPGRSSVVNLLTTAVSLMYHIPVTIIVSQETALIERQYGTPQETKVSILRGDGAEAIIDLAKHALEIHTAPLHSERRYVPNIVYKLTPTIITEQKVYTIVRDRQVYRLDADAPKVVALLMLVDSLMSELDATDPRSLRAYCEVNFGPKSQVIRLLAEIDAGLRAHFLPIIEAHVKP